MEDSLIARYLNETDRAVLDDLRRQLENEEITVKGFNIKKVAIFNQYRLTSGWASCWKLKVGQAFTIHYSLLCCLISALVLTKKKSFQDYIFKEKIFWKCRSKKTTTFSTGQSIFDTGTPTINKPETSGRLWRQLTGKQIHVIEVDRKSEWNDI